MRKKILLSKRRSLSPLSSTIPGARQRLPSLPGDTTEPAPEAAVQNHGPPAPPAAEGLGDPGSGAHPPFAHPRGTPASSAQPPSWTCYACHRQTQRGGPGTRASPSHRDTARPAAAAGELGVKSLETRWCPLSQQPLQPHGRIRLYSQPRTPTRGLDGLQGTEQAKSLGTAGTQQHLFRFRATLNMRMQTQQGN